MELLKNRNNNNKNNARLKSVSKTSSIYMTIVNMLIFSVCGRMMFLGHSAWSAF